MREREREKDGERERDRNKRTKKYEEKDDVSKRKVKNKVMRVRRKL